MTPKEKAKELVSKMLLDHDMPYDLAQECALIAVDEILSEILSIKPDNTFIVNGYYWVMEGFTSYYIEPKKYWEQVKQELLAL